MTLFLGSIQGTVITLEDFGMLIKVSDHIRGLCTRMHLADINLKHPEKKFTDGKKVSCKVSIFHMLLCKEWFDLESFIPCLVSHSIFLTFQPKNCRVWIETTISKIYPWRSLIACSQSVTLQLILFYNVSCLKSLIKYLFQTLMIIWNLGLPDS